MTAQHPDPLDQAAAITEFMTDSAIARSRNSVRPEHDPRFDGKHCVEEECGVEIPKARLADGRIRCVDCQSLREKAQSAFRR